jgi:photosystem II stability/assembly factor-like uncharacterized protein
MDAGAARIWSATSRMAVAVVLVAVIIVVYLRSTMTVPQARPAAGAGQVGAGQVLADVSFASASRGSVAIADEVRRPGRPGVDEVGYVTTDAGATWKQSSHLDFLTANLVFESPDGGVGPERLSADGGRTWHAVSVPDVQALVPEAPMFVDPLHGWWLLRHADGETITSTLWRTVDGGRTWEALHDTGVPSADIPAQAWFLDPLRGVLMAVPSGGTPTLFVTGDGGTTWRPSITLASPLPASPQVSALLFARGDTLFAWLFTHSSALNDANRVAATYLLASTDGGQTWSPPRPGPELQAPIEAPVFDDRGRLLLLDNRCLWVSADDGSTWTARVIQAPEGVVPLDLAFAGPVLLARASERGVGQVHIVDTLLRSTDGGAHWDQVRLP